MRFRLVFESFTRIIMHEKQTHPIEAAIYNFVLALAAKRD